MLTLYGHPISSYTWKVRTALYENDTPFVPFTIDQNTYAEFIALWPMGKFPVLRDGDRKTLVTETSVIIEYLDAHYPGRVRFVPGDADLALEVRRRVCDNYINTPIGKIVTDRLRPEGKRDEQGVEEARRLIRAAYDVIEPQLGERQFIVGDRFHSRRLRRSACALVWSPQYSPRWQVSAHRGASRTVEAAAILRSCGKGIRATLPPLSGRLNPMTRLQ